MSEVLALVPYSLHTAGGQRTSIEAWAPVLAADGINVEFDLFETERLHDFLYLPEKVVAKSVEIVRSLAGRVLRARNLEGFDAVFVYREAALVGPEIVERMITRRRIPLIYGLDDPLFVPYRSPANGVLSRLKCPRKVARICNMANAVIVNGSPLRNFAEQHNDNVWVVPNVVDESSYQPAVRSATVPPCLGWIGSHSSASNLDILAEPLTKLAMRADFELRVIGANRSAVGAVQCATRRWSEETEISELRSFDVGLLPLSDHPWNPWKFNYKLAQYMALAIPPVCTPAGCTSDIIEHGVNGFLASTPQEWVRYLEALVNDINLRRRVGAAAAEYAHRHFTLSANRDLIIGAFRSVLDQTQADRR
jgi:glycosyltransferase involved in cell wall biosynthesis